MGADIGIILAYSAGIMIIFMLSWLFVKPFKLLGKLILNSLLGAVFILITNFFSDYTGLYIGLNAITALILGILGVPGYLAIIIVKLLI